MALQIPMEQGGMMESFLKQMQLGKQNRQKQQQLNDAARFQQRSLDIHQQASDRAQKLLPFTIQKYKDDHNGQIDENGIKHIEYQLTKHFRDEAMREETPEKSSQQSQPQIPQESLPELQDQSAQQQFVEPGSQDFGKPSLQDVMQNFMPQRQPIQGMQQQIKQKMYNPDLNVQDSPAFQPEAPQNGQQQQPAQAPQAGPKTLPNGEVEISPGNPNLYFADKMAGHVKSIPAPQVHFGKDGMIYTRYPSGRTTVVNAGGGSGSTAGMTPEQRLQNQKDIEEAKETNREKLAEYKDTLTETKENRKEAREIRTKAFPLEHALHSVDVIRNIYDKYKTKTGPGAAFGKKLGLLDKKDLGALTTAFGDLQAAVAHNASSKAGIALFNWAGKVKPDTFNPKNFNLGMLESLEDAALYDYSSMNRDHKNLIKKDLPAYNERVKQFEEGNAGGSVPKITVISGGKKQVIDKANLDEAKKLDPDLEVVENG